MTTNNLIKEPDKLLERIWQPDQPVLLFSRAINKQSQSLLNKKLDWRVVDNNGQLECTYTISATHIEFFDAKPRDLDGRYIEVMSRHCFKSRIGLYGILKCYSPIQKYPLYKLQGYKSMNIYFFNKILVHNEAHIDSIALSEAIHTSQELIKTYATQVC